MVSYKEILADFTDSLLDAGNLTIINSLELMCKYKLFKKEELLGKINEVEKIFKDRECNAFNREINQLKEELK